jgi:hypothetical protein
MIPHREIETVFLDMGNPLVSTPLAIGGDWRRLERSGLSDPAGPDRSSRRAGCIR